MVRRSIDKDTKRKILDARRLVEGVMKADGNEAETRRRVERIFESVMGYNALENLSRERAIKGSGETEHVDFAVQLESGVDAEPVIMVELKRVGVDLALKHLRQVTTYAIDAGCEWVLLTNGRDWRIYHVEFGQPPQTKLVEQWNLLNDDISNLAAKFELISYKQVKRGGLEKLWEKTTVLSAKNLLNTLVSGEVLRMVRRILRKNSGIVIEAADIVNGIKKLLNENAANELSQIRICLSDKGGRKRNRGNDPEGIRESETEDVSDALIEETSAEDGDTEKDRDGHL
ncbi:MAG: type I restriction enzyme HsdR N-terminal domain-containing protein [Sedimentisphaerales bacterium]|nr:type I restriction enzyme HsdR N-terminal domain-containing protein [Sedimentisphaerales bacterium]